jgi:hypothetical protein
MLAEINGALVANSGGWILFLAWPVDMPISLLIVDVVVPQGTVVDGKSHVIE